MSNIVKLLGLLVVVSLNSTSQASTITFASGEKATNVIELYTSEGCHSCPPADRWLSKWKGHPELYTEVIPMAFHVDYWDYLGWQDPYADDDHSARQQLFKRQGLSSSVYTPEFIVNSREWSRWFRTPDQLPLSEANPGVLRVSVSETGVSASFESDQPLQLNLAYLGMGLSSKVTAGENNRKTLKHDFVVLKHWRGKPKGEGQWQAKLPKVPDKNQQEEALVVWLTYPNSLQIVQAAAISLP